jgi:predicted transposase/invertase (TIGR01784 family)
MQLLDPKNDAVFKLLFSREKELLQSLLEAIMAVRIAQVTVLNPGLPGLHAGAKDVVLDLLVELEDGTQVDIEMQTRRERAMHERALTYWARLYGQQLEKGETYTQAKPCVIIFICDFATDQGRFHSRFQILETTSHVLFSDRLAIHMVELPRVASAEATQEQALMMWGRFFAAKNSEERKEIAMQNPIIKKAELALSELLKEPDAAELFRMREKAWITRKIISHADREDGRQEGREEGRQEGRQEGRRSLLKVVTKHLCARFGELAPEDVQKLEAADLESLERVAEALLTVANLRDALALLES